MSDLLGSITHHGNAGMERRIIDTSASTVFSIKKPQGVISSNSPILERRGICITGIINWFSIKTKRYFQAQGKKTEDLLQHFLLYWLEQKCGMLKSIDGEFAVVLWAYEREEIWMIRDIFGAEPLHYFCAQRSLAFASRARALWSIPPSPPKVNDDRILDFIVGDLENADQTSTFKQGIFKTPTGSVSHWRKGHLECNQYWNPEIPKGYKSADKQQILDQFQTHLSHAISKRVNPDAIGGLALSGGLDSNAILSCWKQADQKGEYNHHLFSLIPEKEHQTDPESRMLLHQRSRLKGFPYHWITPSRALDLIGPAEMFVRELEDPFAVFALSGTASCYREASDNGISSVVDGMDGDMTAGIPSMHWRFLLKQNQFISSFAECFQHYRYEKETIHAVYVEIIKMLLARFVPVFSKWKKNFIGDVDGTHEKIDSWMKELPFRKDASISDHLHHRIKQLRINHHPIPPNTIEESILNGLKSPMLSVAVDRYRLSAESCNVRPIHPLLDRSLVEFLLQIPWNYRVSKGAPKALLRQHLNKFGYNDVANQRVLGHVGPRFTYAFMQDYFTRNEKPKADSLDALSKYINIKSYLKSYQQAVNVNSFEDSDEDIWNIVMLSEWLVANPSSGNNL